MAMFVSRAQMSSRCWCQSEVSGGWKHLLRALGSRSEPRNFVGYLSALSFPGAEVLLTWRGGPMAWAGFVWVQKMALITCDGLGRAGKSQATPGKQLLSPSTPSGAVLGAMGPAAAWFLPGGKASSSVLCPPPRLVVTVKACKMKPRAANVSFLSLQADRPPASRAGGGRELLLPGPGSRSHTGWWCRGCVGSVGRLPAERGRGAANQPGEAKIGSGIPTPGPLAALAFSGCDLGPGCSPPAPCRDAGLNERP